MNPSDLPIGPEKQPVQKRWWMLFGGSTLWMSILIHLLFGAAAAYIVVQHFTHKHVNFVATAPPAAQEEVEHKVELAKRNNVESAPPDLKRITTSSLSPISLPDVPVSPVPDEITPTALAGTGDIGEGLGGGNGNGGGDGSGSPFGSFDSPTPVLQGYLYDLKQTDDAKSTNMSPSKYHDVLTQFIAADWDPHLFEGYYKSKKPLNTSAVFIPTIHAADGPKAFGVEKEVAPNMYVAWYRVTASAPEDGTYHFVGMADDILLVRVNGQTVLDGSLVPVKADLWHAEKRYPVLNYKPTNSTEKDGLFVGSAIHLNANDPVHMDVMIGEEPGGWSNYFLYIQREESSYFKQSNNTPLLPIFQLNADEIHPKGEPLTFPPSSNTLAPWQAATPEASL